MLRNSPLRELTLGCDCESPDSIWRIIRLAKPELFRLSIATLALLGTSVLDLAYPQLVRLIVDGVLLEWWRHRLCINTRSSSAITVRRDRCSDGCSNVSFHHCRKRIVTRLRQRLFQSIVGQKSGLF